MALTMFDIGACNCTSTDTFQVRGCNSSILDNYDVVVYDHSGWTLLYSLTTSGTGTLSLAPGTYWFQSHDGRFYGPSVAISGSTSHITLTPASTYFCIAECGLPVSTTLHYTDANGTVALAYQSGSGLWIGCGTNASMANVVTAINQIYCNVTTKTTASVLYAVAFNGSTLTVNWCIYTYGAILNLYNGGVGVAAPSCSGSGMNCGGSSYPCATWLSTDGETNTATITCPPSFAASGTNAASGNLGTTDPAAGAWSMTE